jgi:hypothetical protein
MPDEQQQPIPGTWGAVERSTTPMPWRKMLEMCCFSQEELER